jgi:hypothetical protein
VSLEIFSLWLVGSQTMLCLYSSNHFTTPFCGSFPQMHMETNA